MRYIVILFCLISISINAQTVTQPGFRDYQLSGATLPDSILYIMGTDTLDGSAKQGLGKWHRADLLSNYFADTDWLKLGSSTLIPTNSDSAYRSGYTLFKGLYGGLQTKIEMLKDGVLQFDIADGITDQNFIRFKPLQDGTRNVDFLMSTTTTAFSGSRNDNVFYWGWNLGAGGGAVESGKGALGLSMEDFYNPSGTNAYSEFHLIHIDTNGVSRRPFTMFMDVGTTSTWSATFSVADFKLTLPTDITKVGLDFTMPSGNLALLKLLNPATGLGVEMQVNDASNEFQITNTMGGGSEIYLNSFTYCETNILRRAASFGSTATTIAGNDGSGWFTNIGTGWGIDLTSGNLVVDSSQVATQYDLTTVSGGATDLTIGGAGPDYTILSSTGTDVTIGAGTGISLSESPANTLVITNTVTDTDDQGLTLTGTGPYTVDIDNGSDVIVDDLYGIILSEPVTNTLAIKADTSVLATPYDITQIPISSLKAAAATNTINNANYAQEWQWNTLAGATGLKLSSTSTAAASNLHKLFEISTTGANGTSGQSTYGGYFSNTHSGTTSTNYGLYSVATGAASANYGVYGTSNSSGLTGNVGAGVSGRNSNGGIAVEGITTSGGVGVYADSPDGYSIYSTTINGTAGAFRHNWSGNTDYGAQLDIIRNTSNGSNGAAGIGGGINFMAETSTGATSTTNQIKSIWTTATNASRTSSMIFTGVNSATEGDILTLKGSKQLQFHGYGTGGTFTASPVADLFVDATGNVVQGSMTGQSWTADADDATTPVVVSNQTLAFRGNRGIVTDLIDGVVDSISFVIDGDEFIDVTTPEADDWVLLHDENGASADKLEKILWSNLASLVGGTDTHFGSDDLTWTANRTHDESTYTTTIQGSNMYWKFEDTDATAGPSLTLEGNVGNSDAPFGTIQFQYSDSGFATDQAAWTLKANRETNDQEHSTLEITANEASAAPPVVVFEENQNLSDNTQETFIQLNGGIAKTQYWESATSNAITLDRGYYNVALLTGHTGTITLPEIYGINEANTEVTATLVPIGQEYVITNLSGSSVTIAAINNTGTANDDWLNNTEAGTYTLVNGNSIIVKATTIVSNEGHWFIY